MTWIKDTVQKFIKRYDTNDAFELTSFMNINVVYWDLHEEIKGFYKYDKRNKYIVVNSNSDEKSQTFTCAHDLGHARLHPRVNTPFLREKIFLSVDRIKSEADAFGEHKDLNMKINEIASLYCVPNEVAHLKSLRNIHKFSPGGD